MKRPDAFVFVATGPERHLARLEGAVARVRRHCENPVWVVTDAARNERPLALDGVAESVLDVRTPGALGARQASIFLKTSLHRHLPADRTWCYLDTDVLALDPGAEQVFLHARGGATFAADHLRLRAFSPYAVACGCRPDVQTAEQETVLRLLRRHYQPRSLPRHERTRAVLAPALARYVAPVDTRAGRARRGRWVKRHLGLSWHEEERSFAGPDGSFGLAPDGALVHSSAAVNPIPWVESRTGCRFDAGGGLWRDSAGAPLFPEGCDHLVEAIRSTFDVSVSDPDWQHWNGGVLVFDARGAELLDLWHDWTLRIFDDPRWRVRDQGTLVAAVWRLGLQDRPTLPPAFNFIVRAGDQSLETDPALGLSRDGGDTWTRPHLVHAMHGWDDPQWVLWTWLRARENGATPPVAAPAPSLTRSWLRRLRARVWWMHVLPPAVAVGYVAAALADVPFVAVARALPAFLVSGGALCAFGYALNDTLDVEADSRGGKANGMADLPRGRRWTIVTGLALLGLLPWVALPRTPLTLGLLALQLALLVAYSAPPLRLKTRSVLGLFADAGYGHVVPAALGAATFAALGRPLAEGSLVAAWLGAGAVACKGLRNILGHQLDDRMEDEAAGQWTFVVFQGPRCADCLLYRWAAPLEAALLVAALVVLLPQAPLLLGFVAFLAHAAFVLRPWHWPKAAARRLTRRAVRYLLNDFHEEWLAPTALLILAWRDPRYLVLLPMHLLLFPNLLRKLAKGRA